MTPYTSIKEVRIPVGPNGDFCIAMRFDEEEGLVFDHKLIPHVCGKHGVKGEVQTLSVPAKGSRAKFWIQDVDMTSSQRTERRS